MLARKTGEVAKDWPSGRLARRNGEFTRVDLANVDSVRDIAHVLFDRFPRGVAKNLEAQKACQGIERFKGRERFAGVGPQRQQTGGVAQHRDGVVAAKEAILLGQERPSE
jgi:hypothetical protein